MTEPSATIVLDSVSPAGHRLTTMEVVMHRFVLAEFNTHRVFSRNSESSRAVPVHKRIERVRTDPALPLSWPAEQKGMQGGYEIAWPDAANIWREAAQSACIRAELLVAGGIHKSVVNRLLEPFLWHTVLVSSTEWENFFKQRCSPLAQPEIRAAAEAMRDALAESEPTEVAYGEWHTPYVQPNERRDFDPVIIREISAARCARVSYLTHDGQHDPNKDLELFKRLITSDPPHASPLEHVATPLHDGYLTSPTHRVPAQVAPGNFHRWRQLRHDVLGSDAAAYETHEYL